LFGKIISNRNVGQIYKERELFYKRAVVVLKESQGNRWRSLFGPFFFCPSSLALSND
jgi:hypothetical protein